MIIGDDISLKKQKAMKTPFTMNTPTDSRKNSLFSSFSDSKRIRWAADRQLIY